MVAALFSVALHAALFLFLGDWLEKPPRRLPVVMVARLLKPANPAPVVPEEIAGEQEDFDTGAAASSEPGSDARPDGGEVDALLFGYDDVAASLAVQSGAGRGLAMGRLRLGGVAVARAKSAAAPADLLSRRGLAGRGHLSVSTAAAGRDRDIRAAILEIREKIESRKTYPLMARRRGWEGDVLVEIVLGDAGELKGLRLLRQSGFPLLDRATLTAVRAAVPFPPVPGRVKIPVSYRLVPD